MKKLILILTILFCGAIYSRANDRLNSDTTKTKPVDTVKINKKIMSLKGDLTDYQTKLSKVQTQLPTDSVAIITATSKADDALNASKKSANNAVGGDADDAKAAAKKAKKASDAQDDVVDAKKQLERDRKDIIKYNKKIQDTQKKIDELTAQLPKQ